jgi:hypothetical protein
MISERAGHYRKISRFRQGFAVVCIRKYTILETEASSAEGQFLKSTIPECPQPFAKYSRLNRIACFAWKLSFNKLMLLAHARSRTSVLLPRVATIRSLVLLGRCDAITAAAGYPHLGAVFGEQLAGSSSTTRTKNAGRYRRIGVRRSWLVQAYAALKRRWQV